MQEYRHRLTLIPDGSRRRGLVNLVHKASQRVASFAPSFGSDLPFAWSRTVTTKSGGVMYALISCQHLKACMVAPIVVFGRLRCPNHPLVIDLDFMDRLRLLFASDCSVFLFVLLPLFNI